MYKLVVYGAAGGSPHRVFLEHLERPSNKRTHVWREATLAPLLVGCSMDTWMRGSVDPWISVSTTWISRSQTAHPSTAPQMDALLTPRALKENPTGERRTGRSWRRRARGRGPWAVSGRRACRSHRDTTKNFSQ